MKKTGFSLLIFLLFTAVSFAQTSEADAQAEKKEGPVMTFETTMIDYGTIEQHADPLRVFNFTNTGTEPLIIKNAKGSCGCTVPKWPKEPIMPGENGTIEVRYDTKRIGPFSKRVTLTTNSVEDPIVLTIKGKVNPKPAEPAGVPESQPNFLQGGSN
jgi:hypothetical protein